MIIAIDGPAGAGKGTVTSHLAKDLNLINIDTGVTYRCVALETLRNGIELENKKEIIEISDKIKIEINNENKVFLNGKDVTKEIRSKEVNEIVSQISSIKEVRINMVNVQRNLANGKNVIMEGRDITTYVFPNADVKIYLDGELEERIKRRYLENKEKNINMTYDEVKENIIKRDTNDKNKEIGSLKIAQDAIVVDSTNLSIQETVQKIKEIILKKIGKDFINGNS